MQQQRGGGAASAAKSNAYATMYPVLKGSSAASAQAAAAPQPVADPIECAHDGSGLEGTEEYLDDTILINEQQQHQQQQQQQYISHSLHQQMAAHQYYSNEQARRAFHVDHQEPNHRRVVVQLNGLFSINSLASGREGAGMLVLGEALAAQFQHEVIDRDARQIVRVGDVTRAQVRKVSLLAIRSALPLPVGIDSPQLSHCQCNKIHGQNGVGYPAVIEPETAVDFTLHNKEGHLLYYNNKILDDAHFQEWGGVNEEDLTKGITPIAGSGTSLLNVQEATRLVSLLANNFEALQAEFPDFDYGHMLDEARRGHTHVRIYNSVLDRLVTIGLELGITPVARSTISLPNLSFRLRSITGPNGHFSDAIQRLTEEFQSTGAQETQHYVSLKLAIVAIMTQAGGGGMTVDAQLGAPAGGPQHP